MGQSDIELIRLLLSFGADPALIDTFYDKNTTLDMTSQGNNCLHYMALAPSAFVDFAMLQNLVEKGNDMLEARNGQQDASRSSC